MHLHRAGTVTTVTQIFVSYRRDDSGGRTGRIVDRLFRAYGRRAVFRDVDTIRGGTNFVEAIGEALDSADVQLVVIGPDWLAIDNDDGGRRIDDPSDYVALEVATGLNRPDLRVIPVLVGGASMPTSEQLPPSLRALALRNAVEVRDTRWEDDVDTLVEQIGGGGFYVVGLSRRAWAAGLLAVVALVTVAILWPNSPDPMTGQFRVAIAEFVDASGEQTQFVANLSEDVFRDLESELTQLNDQESFGFEVRSPAQTGPVADADEAAALAQAVDADVVVFGSVGDGKLEPQFYLRQRPGATGGGEPHFLHAEELTGQYYLGSEILSSGLGVGGLGPTANAVETLASRTRALAQFVIGLSWYVAEPPALEKALNHFEAALGEEGWSDEDGKEVLYLFVGNTFGRMGDLDEAAERYETALRLSDGEYARAHLGVAEVRYQRARGDCKQGNVDSEGLRAALDAVEAATQAQAAPVSDVDVKAAFIRARVHRCLSQALEDNFWTEAEDDLRFVIGTFEAGNNRIAELAAEAHAELALVLAPESPNSGSILGYGESILETEIAIQLTQSNVRRATFWDRLAYFYERSNQEENALQAREEANQLYASASVGMTELATPSEEPEDEGATTTSVAKLAQVEGQQRVGVFARDVPDDDPRIPIEAIFYVSAPPEPPMEMEEPPCLDHEVDGASEVERFKSTSFEVCSPDDNARVLIRSIGAESLVVRDEPLEPGVWESVEFEARGDLPLGDYRITVGSSTQSATRTFTVIANIPRIDAPSSVEILQGFSIRIDGFRPGLVAVIIRSPDGVPVVQADLNSPGAMAHVVEPLISPGEYSIAATQDELESVRSLIIERRSDPTMRLLEPTSGHPGTIFRVGLAGYTARQQIDLRVYRGPLPDRAELRSDGAGWQDLGTVSIDANADGEAVLDLPSSTIDPPGMYCVVPDGDPECVFRNGWHHPNLITIALPEDS